MKRSKTLVIGLGLSGVAAVKALDKLGKDIIVYDSKEKNQLEDKINELKHIKIQYYFNDHDFDLSNIELVIKSPGVPVNIPIIKRLEKENIKIISDIEAAYKNSNNKIVAVTGTNGKTTTTTLIGEFLKNAGIRCIVTGNIGSGMFLDALEATNEEILVAETSSYQLEHTIDFKPNISIILNITPDHLVWHGGYDNYKNSKLKVAKNQDENDYCILNLDDTEVISTFKNIKAKKILFSVNQKIDEGLFIENDKIIYKNNNEKKEIVNINKIFISGKHNLENALAAIGVALILNISTDIIEKVLIKFRGIEHRFEYVGNYKGINFYNDSKGTNPVSSIKAIEAVKKPIILIAGGYDKGSCFDSYIKSFNNKVKHLIVLGDTADKIIFTAKENNFTNITKVNSIDEAVKTAYSIGKSGDNVLLSPACASWDMYSSFEKRGKDFKERVLFYGGSVNNGKKV